MEPASAVPASVTPRVRDRLREPTISRDHHRDLERLHAHDDVVEVEVFEDPDLAEREVDHPLGFVANIPGLSVADRAVVHTDANRRLLLLGPLHDLAHPVLVVDVPGVETQLVDLRVERHEGELVIEVDVGDDRQDRAANDLFQSLAGALVRNGDARDLAAGLLQELDLADGRVDIVGEGRAHRLHRDGSAVADRRAADPDEARSSGRFRSTFIGASTTSSLDAVQGVSEHHPGVFRLPFLGFFEEAQEPWILVEGVVLVTARRLDDQQIPLGAGHLLIAVADARERRQEELPARAKLVPERSHLTREGFLERGRLRLAKPQDDHDCLRHVLLDRTTPCARTQRLARPRAEKPSCVGTLLWTL